MNVEQSFLIEAEISERRSAFAIWLKKRRWFVLCVIVPTIVAAVYYGLIASDIYTSESRFVIKSPDQKRSQPTSLASLIQTTGLSAGQEQANEVLDFVRSRDALKLLERDPGIRSRYASSRIDAFSRFPRPFADGGFEGMYKYYGRMVDAHLDNETGIAVITVKAFAAKDAYEINRHLLQLSEGLVNQLNERAQANGIAEALKQVALATVRAKQARTALGAYRNKQELIDPSKQAIGVLEIANSLTAQRAALQAQLELMLRVAPNNPSIPELRNRIHAISGQIASQDSRVVGTDSGIASKMGGYENLLVEQEFSTKNLDVANAALVQARAEAQRQQFYLERIVDPNMPDRPMLPHRILSVIVIAACALCLYFIGWMFTVGILEHASED
jgi:capsular polysaccharide transport system permease protein